MSVPHDPSPVILFFAVLAAPGSAVEALKRRLQMEYSEFTHALEPYSFAESHYYSAEMGQGLVKTIWVCRETINPEELVGIKLHTNRIEEHYAGTQGRSLNIDPGYLSLSRVVLATGKDNAHRIYVGQGIYEEITLLYKRNEGFQPLAWTYPDYREPNVLDFFEQARQAFYDEQRRQECTST